MPAAEVVERDGKFFWPGPDGEIEVFQEFGKIGKSLKNSVSPDEICDDYGADTLRVYEMSMGPLEASRPWATKDVVGAYRFLQRVWRLVVDEQTGRLRVTDDDPDDETLRALHRTIAGVSDDYAALRNNTAARQADRVHQPPDQEHSGTCRAAAVEPLVLMVAPLAPHLAEELWQPAGPRHVAGARPVPASPTRPTWPWTPSSSRFRSTERCAATSRWPPTPTPTRSRRRRWPTRRCRHSWPARRRRR